MVEDVKEIETFERETTTTTTTTSNNEDERQYPSLKVVLPAMLAIWLAFFLVALDRTIIGTAVPTISKEFNSFGDIAWYEAGFLLPLCLLQLTFGLVYKYYSTKWTLTTSVALFELGSIVCATAPNSKALIIGRVITGIGGVGISTGSFLVITHIVPLRSRPKYIGSLGSCFGISSAIGPVAGGYLTSITWRWCFWINVPIGAVSFVLLLLLIPNTPPLGVKPKGAYARLKQLDPIGFILIAPAVTCLLFALQFGGTKYAWDSGRIIAFLVIFGLFALAFVLWQSCRGEKATVPPRISTNTDIISGCLAYAGYGSCLILYPFYLPIWFQVVQAKSPQSSGVSLLPLLLSVVFAVILSGILTEKIGYYTPILIAGTAILIVGSGLIVTWRPDTGAGIWIGYQIVLGIGTGTALQGPNIAAQTVLPDEDISVALALLNFVNFLASTVFISIAQTILERKLVSNLAGLVPDLNPSHLANGGAASLRSAVPADKLPQFLDAYNQSIRSIWYLGLGLACLSFLASCTFRWKSVKTEKVNKNGRESVSIVPT